MKPRHLLHSIGLATMMSTFAAQAAGLSNEQGTFGKLPDGTPIEKYTLQNSNGVQATVITYGGILQSLVVPDKNGKGEDIVLGFDDVDGYLKNGNVYFGATIGRFGNRIAEGRFELDGNTYQLPQNDGSNALHGGPEMRISSCTAVVF